MNMYSGKAGMDKRKSQNGFTLVELITVVAIISLLVVYISIQVGRSNDDAKVGIATTFLLGNVPSAIASYKSRHMSSCTSLPSSTGSGTGTGAGTDTLKSLLTDRGLVGNTPWDEPWTVSYDNSNRIIKLTFPTKGSEDADKAAQDIRANIDGKPQIADVQKYTTGDDQLIVTYNCM